MLSELQLHRQCSETILPSSVCSLWSASYLFHFFLIKPPESSISSCDGEIKTLRANLLKDTHG